MTFYVILQWFPLPKGWCDISEPEHFLDAKKRMYELKKVNPNEKYRLIKTSY